jgi:protein-S-isoprenylcysteine O-methyltransferase Ste14
MSGFQGRLPIILSLSFVLIILTGAAYHFRSSGGPMLGCGVAMVSAYILWLVVESRIALGETKKGSTQKDKWTLEIYAAARMVTVISALFLPSIWEDVNPTMIFGGVLFVVAIGFRLYAIRTLGRFYSHRVRLADDHQIVSSGPYAFLRHPAYTGMLLGHLGVVLFFMNWVSLALWGLFFVPAVVARILVEEEALMQIPGYADFAAKRKRLLPFVW